MKINSQVPLGNGGVACVAKHELSPANRSLRRETGWIRALIDVEDLRSSESILARSSSCLPTHERSGHLEAEVRFIRDASMSNSAKRCGRDA